MQNPLVLPFGRFVERSGRKRGNRHTHRLTDRHTDQVLQAPWLNPVRIRLPGTIVAHAYRGLISTVYIAGIDYLLGKTMYYGYDNGSYTRAYLSVLNYVRLHFT